MSQSKSRLFFIVSIFCVAVAIASPAQTFKTLANFNDLDGANSYARLVQGTDGNFYGTTYQGGASEYYGETFKVTPQGTLTVLHSFEGSDGAFPFAPLVLGTDGDFYGTTTEGGAGSECTATNGCGTVFKLKIVAGVATLTTLYSFCSQANCADGFYPQAGLVEGTDGNLYGSTGAGGNGSACTTFEPAGCGTIFKITRTGQLTTLHVFNLTDGYFPLGALLQGTDGNFYGTTSEGGTSNSSCGFGCGTVFKMTKTGTLTTLHDFEASDGAFPPGELVQASNGTFYGTTEAGGAYDDCGPTKFWCGTIFEITPTATFTSLFSFDGTDGADPTAGLTLATDGNFYGSTSSGGTNNSCPGGCGTIFKFGSSGLTTLYDLCSQSGCSDGADPAGGLLQATNGIFYGTALSGGTLGPGTVFSESVALGPFVVTNPTSGKVGSKVTILGNNLAKATAVSFNGTAATIIKATNTAITTTVPTSATTGYVTVTTPSGTLKSNVPFAVP